MKKKWKQRLAKSGRIKKSISFLVLLPGGTQFTPTVGGKQVYFVRYVKSTVIFK